MKLNELKTILYSNRGTTQFAILYDSNKNEDVANGTIDAIVKNYSEKEVIRIEAFGSQLIITI